MHINDFDYRLPPELIAKYPLLKRDECRLLRLARGVDYNASSIEHLAFRDILNILQKGDRLVFNNTRVIPARVFCRKDTVTKVELFFTEPAEGGKWKVLVKPAKRASVGHILHIDKNPQIRVRIDKVMDGGYERLVSLMPTDNIDDTSGVGKFENVIERYGRIPLPHYMERDDEDIDKELYQTVYAGVPGAVAAPTAGLHFTDALFDELGNRGIDKSFVTLHTGIGTFRPVQVDDPRLHDIHEERYELREDTACEINETWKCGGRVIAVGTTVVRVLESCAVSYHKISSVSPDTRTKLMILPPYEFKAVDGLITNFHLPKSTLLMLVSAFTGSVESVLSAYEEAVKQKYRFYSYGDAMIII